MDDLVQWLGKQYDEDERITRAASWGDGEDAWHAKSSPYDTRGKVKRWYVEDAMDEGVVTHVDPQAAQDEGVARHIAEWDPARVLREIDAKRQMLRDADDFCAEYNAEIDDDNSAAQRADCWRDTIRRNLAAGYAHRPGYLEEWAPTD